MHGRSGGHISPVCERVCCWSGDVIVALIRNWRDEESIAEEGDAINGGRYNELDQWVDGSSPCWDPDISPPCDNSDSSSTCRAKREAKLPEMTMFRKTARPRDHGLVTIV